jgi:precorrin-2 dehydrogenase / sirohydrochlorin ferrochelatase
MVPIALDSRNAHLAVAGNGTLALRRLHALRAAGAARTLVFADAPSHELAQVAGGYLREGLPDEPELAALNVLWIAGLPEAVAASLAAAAHKNRVLVNVEDRPEHCDFYSVAEVRRENLLLTVSTGGAAPGLAASIRRNLENCFGPEWDERVSEVAGLRNGWRAEGLPMVEVARRIDALVEERCWLSCPKPH